MRRFVLWSSAACVVLCTGVAALAMTSPEAIAGNATLRADPDAGLTQLLPGPGPLVLGAAAVGLFLRRR